MDLHPHRTGTISADEDARAQLRALGTSGSDAAFEAFSSALLAALSAEADAALPAVRAHSFLATLPQGAAAADALLALAIDHVRCCVPPLACATALAEDYGFRPARAQAFAAALAARADAIRARLVLAGTVLPRIVDLRWRLDFLVSSKAGGKQGTPLYLIDLHLASAAGERSVRSFTCTPPELEDLRLKVKDALQAATALAAAAPA